MTQLSDFEKKLKKLWKRYQDNELDPSQYVLEVKKLEKELKKIAKGSSD
ncbi:MAG: hypothetical protein ACOC6H_03810 [Thermoproteota archaeon]